MEQRLNFYEKGPNAMRALYGLGAYMAKSPVEKSLRDLICFRVSQINGCAFCLDMHSKDLRAAGETEQRLYMLDAWRETTVYTDRERAALAFAEGVTKAHVSDEVYAEATKQFTDQELVDLTIGIISINSFNRINIVFHTPSGSYQPGQYAAVNN
jgi:AhpD family alkylhydroperoxidase